MPGLSPSSGVLEDELGEETIDPWTEQTATDVEDLSGFDELAERPISMEPKDLGNPKLRVCGCVLCPGEILLGGDYKAVVDNLPTGFTADLHHAFEHGLANIRAGKTRDDEETVIVPLLLHRCVDHRFIPILGWTPGPRSRVAGC